jgi:hypothetical protein
MRNSRVSARRPDRGFLTLFKKPFLKLDWRITPPQGALAALASRQRHPIVPLGVRRRRWRRWSSIALLFAFFLALRNLLKVR